MQIINLRQTGAGATFDVEVAPGITLRDWTMKRTGGGLRAFPPRIARSRCSVTLAPQVHEQIRAAAAAVLEGAAPYAHN